MAKFRQAIGGRYANRKFNAAGQMELGGVGGKLGPHGSDNNTVSIGGLGKQEDRHGDPITGGLGKKSRNSLISEGSINSFLSKIVHEGRFLQKHTYQIDIIAPRGMTVARDLPMRCESITLPGTNVETSSDNIRKGPAREHAFNMNFGPVSGVFLCDRDQKERTFF